MAELCEKAGCEIIAGIGVEELVKDDSGAVIGIKAGDDEITSQVVILAEGVNSLLAERSLGVPRPKRNEMAVGCLLYTSHPVRPGGRPRPRRRPARGSVGLPLGLRFL